MSIFYKQFICGEGTSQYVANGGEDVFLASNDCECPDASFRDISILVKEEADGRTAKIYCKCPRSTQFVDGTCQPCPANTISDTSSPAVPSQPSVCKPCPKGSICPSAIFLSDYWSEDIGTVQTAVALVPSALCPSANQLNLVSTLKEHVSSGRLSAMLSSFIDTSLKQSSWALCRVDLGPFFPSAEINEGSLFIDKNNLEIKCPSTLPRGVTCTLPTTYKYNEDANGLDAIPVNGSPVAASGGINSYGTAALIVGGVMFVAGLVMVIATLRRRLTSRAPTDV